MDASNDPFSSPHHDTKFGSNPSQFSPQRDPIDTFDNLNLDEFNKKLTPEEIERAYQDPRILCLIDELVNVDPNRYFYVLAKKAAKLPQGFDVSTIVEGATQNQFPLGTTSSQKKSTTLPLETTTDMTTITTHIPNISTVANKKTHATKQGKHYTFGSS